MKTKRELLTKSLLTAMPLITAFQGFGQNLVINGNFEMPAVTNATKVDYPTNLSPWQTTATNFEIWTNGWNNPSAGIGPLNSADGHQNLEILSQGTNATIWQSVPTVQGERYLFSFYFSPRPKSSSDVFAVSIDSNKVFSAVEDGDGLTNFNWQQFRTNFVAQSNLTTLSFSDQSLTDGGSGTHIDGVVLEHEPWLAIENTGAALELSWLGDSNEMYQLQTRTDLTTGSWSNLSSQVPGNGTSIFFLLTPQLPQAFYRLTVGP